MDSRRITELILGRRKRRHQDTVKEREKPADKMRRQHEDKAAQISERLDRVDFRAIGENIVR